MQERGDLEGLSQSVLLYIHLFVLPWTASLFMFPVPAQWGSGSLMLFSIMSEYAPSPQSLLPLFCKKLWNITRPQAETVRGVWHLLEVGTYSSHYLIRQRMRWYIPKENTVGCFFLGGLLLIMWFWIQLFYVVPTLFGKVLLLLLFCWNNVCSQQFLHVKKYELKPQTVYKKCTWPQWHHLLVFGRCYDYLGATSGDFFGEREEPGGGSDSS